MNIKNIALINLCVYHSDRVWNEKEYGTDFNKI